jgi:hypothetical protein
MWYEEDRIVDTLPTVVGIILLSVIWTVRGNDKHGVIMLRESAEMGNRLQLYKTIRDCVPPLNIMDNDVRTAAAHTAWGTFNWQMQAKSILDGKADSSRLISMSFHMDPFVKSVPRLPIPGLQLPKTAPIRPLPAYMGGTFTRFCTFWTIMFDVIMMHRRKEAASLAHAQLIYRRLLKWASELSGEVKRGSHASDHVVALHIWLHTAIVYVLRPYAGIEPQPKLTTFSSSDATPDNVVAASIRQLKRLIYTYRLRFETANFDILWHTGMLYVMNHILHENATRDSEFYFLLCMRGYQRLGRYVPIVGGIMQSLFAMAIRTGTILPEEARRLFGEMRNETEIVGRFWSTYPIDLRMVSTNSKAAALETLVREFNEMTLESSPTVERRAEPVVEMPPEWKGDAGLLSATLIPDENEADDFDHDQYAV